MGRSPTVLLVGYEPPEEPVEPDIPEDTMVFVARYPNGKVAPNTTIVLANKNGTTWAHQAITNVNGAAVFMGTDLIPLDVKGEWLLMAYMDGEAYGFVKDGFELAFGHQIEITLKEYKAAPEFEINIQLRDIIGTEIWSNLAVAVEKAALEYSGLKVTSIEGAGTKNLKIKFVPPWRLGSIHIYWSAVWFIFAILSLVVSIVVFKWTFGESAGAVASIGGGSLKVMGLVILAGKGKKGNGDII